MLIVGVDEGLRGQLSSIADAAGWIARSFASAAQFGTECRRTGLAVVVVDLASPTGTTVLEHAGAEIAPHPVIALAGTTAVDSVARAFHLGATDVIQTPALSTSLSPRLAQAMDEDRLRSELRDRFAYLRALTDSLTPRELQVMEHVVAGEANKRTAAELAISMKTVEVHRCRIMAKMRATSLADLVRMNVEIETGHGAMWPRAA